MSFVIIASPRTGSTHLTSLLHRQPDIVCHGELFHPKKENILGRWRSSEAVAETTEQLVALRGSNPQAFVSRIFANKFKGGCVGFKIFEGHNDQMLDHLIADPGVRKIVLFRRNMLAVHSSSRIAHAVGERVLRTARATQPVVAFEPQLFMKFCRKYSCFYHGVVQKLNATRQNYYFLHYEEINDSSLFAGLLNFIGANSTNVTLRPASVKQNSSEILRRFSNPDIAEEFLRAHGLMEWMYETEVRLDVFADEARKKADAISDASEEAALSGAE